jgi:nitroreductase
MLDLVRKRRSVRKYRSKPIEPELIELLEAAVRSPRVIQAMALYLHHDRSKLESIIAFGYPDEATAPIPKEQWEYGNPGDGVRGRILRQSDIPSQRKFYKRNFATKL